ncbi:hypothetical protein EVJ58_g6513 [Rhodofomes roseus]|uniref:Aminopeptidase P N-terminal domain-containing protein n=1 Tax=Rhodofomes roseus TaxID=34475 RepID=A0A4Y9Y7Y4_9APHY|nr:hypothetical protein EVJ58_g6513 [Rhodofomes roseus]
MSLRPLILGSAARTARTLVRQCQRTQRLYATEATQLANIALKPTIYGQPLDPSHPHLLKNGELTPGITSQEYETRRRALMDSLPPHSAVICAAAQVKYMSGHLVSPPIPPVERPLIHRPSYKFRQDSDFWYLTGFEEPGAAFIMEKDSSSRGYRMTLFHTPSTPSTAQWDGARTSAEDVVRLFRADNARPVDELLDSLRRVMAETDHVYVDLPPGGGPKRSRSASTKSLLKLIRENELVLVDAGCEYNGYASDITRTFPVSGAFTSAQADLYGALLSAQKQLVALCTARAGVSLAQLHHKSVEFLGRELRQIGFDLGMAGGRVAELYPHFVGHPVGIGK